MRAATLLLACALGACGSEVGTRSQYGELVECNFVTGSREEGIETVRARIQTEPGEVLTVTHCHNYVIVDDVEQEPHFDYGPTGCKTEDVIADGEELLLLCSDYVGLPGESATEYGFEEIYVKRN